MTHMPINPQIVTMQEIRIAVIMITINVSFITDASIKLIKFIFSSRIELGSQIIRTREFKTNYFETRISFFKRPKDRNSNYT